MSIFIVTWEGFPYGMAATSRITCYAKALLMAGISCEVLVYHRSEINRKKLKNNQAEGVFEGIHFKYIGGTTFRASNVFLRKWNDWMDEKRTILYLQEKMKSGDSILIYMREKNFGQKLSQFAHEYGYSIVRDLCEYPYATSHEKKTTKQLQQKYFEKIFPKLDGSICISEALMKEAIKSNPHGKHIKIPILIDEKKWEMNSVEPIQLDYPYIFHSGTLLQQKDGIIDVLNAFADALPQLPKGTKYIFTGNLNNSIDKFEIQKVLKKRMLISHVEFLGFISKKNLFRYIKGASLFIINKQRNLQNKYCFATKLGEYLLSGNPILTTNIGEVTNYLKNDESAYIVEAGDSKQLSNAIICAFRETEKSKNIGQKGALVANKFFTCKAVSVTLANYFKNISDYAKK